MTQYATVLLGPPGTGKTAELMRRVQKAIDRGVPADRIAYLSFSRAAVGEALARVGGNRDTHPWFRTIHSLGYHLAGINSSDMVDNQRLQEFSTLIGEPVSAIFHPDSVDEMRVLNTIRGTPADVALALKSKASAAGTSVEHEYHNTFEPILSSGMDVGLTQINRILAEYKAFKDRFQLWDFDDLVLKASGTLDVDVCFLDEAQDTTTSQWDLLFRTLAEDAELTVAGDDDQCVYRWSGADPGPLGTIEGERTILQQSYRVPRDVRDLALRIAQKIPGRIEKSFNPRSGDPGAVRTITDPDYIDLRAEGSWMLLSRTQRLLSGWRLLAREQGVVYQEANGKWSNDLPFVRAALSYHALQRGRRIEREDVDNMYRFLPEEHRMAKTFRDVRALNLEVEWSEVFVDRLSKSREWYEVLQMSPEDAGYIRSLRRNNEPLTGPGRVRISTVHAAKGLEADHVAVQMAVPKRVAQSPQQDVGDERRVQYVAMTRARRQLFLLHTPSPYQWEI